MKDLLFTPMGFWTVFTLAFIIILMGYFVYKVMRLSEKK